MILNLIMLIAMYPMILIVGYVMWNSLKPKNGIIFGSKLSTVYWQEEEVKQIQSDFAKAFKRNFLIAAVLPFSCFLIPYVSIQITIWTLWVFAFIVMIEAPYVTANRKIKELKQERGWYREEKQTEYIEIKAAGEIRRVIVKTFLVPITVSALAAAFVYLAPWVFKKMPADAAYVQIFGSVVVLFALINVLLLVAALWMDKQKTEVISNDSDVNINYTRAKKNLWKDFWLAVSWLTTGFVIICAVSLVMDWNFGMVVLLGSAVYSLVAAGLIFPLVKKIGRIEKAYADKWDLEYEQDDDKQWIWGMLYYNPADKHTMVSNRIGTGTTFNMATPVGKGFMVFTVLVVLWVPLLCTWVIFEEFTPISLSISGDELKAEHLKVEYELQVEDMKEITLIGELPEMSKSVGTAMDNLLKGTFYVYNEGNVEVFLNPQNEVFLKIETGEETYYFGGRTDEETLAVYENLQ